MQKEIDMLYESVMDFTYNAYGDIMSMGGINEKDLRIAMPEHIKYLMQNYSGNRFVNRYEKVVKIRGIETHPSWENAITMYHKDYALGRFNDIPVFKMCFGDEIKEDSSGNKTLTIQFVPPTQVKEILVKLGFVYK